jgi:hypothetical protein
MSKGYIQGKLMKAGMDISGAGVNLWDTTNKPLKVGGTETLAIKSTTTTLSTAQILANYTTPITLVAAPGAGKALIFHGAEVFLDFGGTAFVAGTNEDFQIQYDGGTACSELALQVNLIEASADVYYWMNPKQSVIIANQELEAATITGNVATGNGAMKIKCFYSVLTLQT